MYSILDREQWLSEPFEWTSECPDVKNYKWLLNPVWHRMLYSCTHVATVGVKGFRHNYCVNRAQSIKESVTKYRHTVYMRIPLLNHLPRSSPQFQQWTMSVKLVCFLSADRAARTFDRAPRHYCYWLVDYVVISAASNPLPSRRRTAVPLLHYVVGDKSPMRTILQAHALLLRARAASAISIRRSRYRLATGYQPRRGEGCRLTAGGRNRMSVWVCGRAAVPGVAPHKCVYHRSIVRPRSN